MRDPGAGTIEVAAITAVQPQLSLLQHLEIAPNLLNSSQEVLEEELQPLMMAQAVPAPPSDPSKKRVKVYELRNNDWVDRGTGFCTATYVFVRSSRASAHALRWISLHPRKSDASPY